AEALTRRRVLLFLQRLTLDFELHGPAQDLIEFGRKKPIARARPDTPRPCGFPVCVHRPDVILMDLQMPELNGVDAMIAICAEFPAARIIVLTTYRRVQSSAPTAFRRLRITKSSA